MQLANRTDSDNTNIIRPIFSIGDMIIALNQLRPDNPSQRPTIFVIAWSYFSGLFTAAFSSFKSSIFKQLIRNKIITYLDDVFIQDTTIDTMLHTLEPY